MTRIPARCISMQEEQPMTMPGFTAEASFARTTGFWKTEAFAPAAAREARVVPQFCYCNPDSSYCTCCVCAPGYGCWCTTHHLIRALA